MTTAIIPFTSKVYRDYHWRISSTGKILLLVCATGNHHYGISVFSPSPGSSDIINLHNHHLWTTDNPHGMVETSRQQQFSINVWAGIIGDCLLGPILLPQCLNGETYLVILQNTLPPLLKNVPLAIRQRVWLQYNGAPAHFCINVCQHLNNIFPRCWIGRGGPIAWPAWSPDINPLDFYLWGAAEKFCVHWVCSWYLDPSVACSHSLWCYLDTVWNIWMSEAIHGVTCACMHCIPWRPLWIFVVI